MVSARWVHYAQFIEAVQLWLERPRLSGGRPRAATIFGIAAASMGGALLLLAWRYPIARLPAWAAAGMGDHGVAGTESFDGELKARAFVVGVRQRDEPALGNNVLALQLRRTALRE